MSASTSSTLPGKAALTRQKLVDATVGLILRQGFTATSVDEVCAAAGVTKGSFFHHFPNKEAIGIAAAAWWGDMGTRLYAAAWEDPAMDPLDQVHRLFDIMTGFTERPGDPCVCVVGMLSQELSGTHPEVRTACAGHLGDWTGNVARLLAAAKAKHPPAVDFDPESIAWFLNSLWQGSMLVAKTCQSQEMIRSNLRHARTLVDGLFGLSSGSAGSSSPC